MSAEQGAASGRSFAHGALSIAGILVVVSLLVTAALHNRTQVAAGASSAAPIAAPTTTQQLPTAKAIGAPAYPLTLSRDGRLLVDQNGMPFLIVGDSPQAMIGNVSLADARKYLASRKTSGFNVIWTNLLCNSYTSCHADGTTYDGIAPFTARLSTGRYNLGDPNPAYFARADAMINQAAQDGMVVFLDPIETGGWLQTLVDNGKGTAYTYGQFLGNRYKSFANIVWMSGNDFQNWRQSALEEVVQAVADGIRSVDPNHLQTVELSYNVSDSLSEPSWTSRIGLDAVYSYLTTYSEMLLAYNRGAMPAFLVEGNYEGEDNISQGFSGVKYLREQTFWTLLSGGIGQIYGNHAIWRFSTGWKQQLDSLGVRQLRYADALFSNRQWYNLVPDQHHTLVTAGYGTFASNAPIPRDNYATAALTPNGSLGMVYLPTLRTITVNMAKLAGPTTARWYDPTSGTYAPAAASAVPNAGTSRFTPPGNNGAGDGDWVLVLEAY
jgi:hypothetical protein